MRCLGDLLALLLLALMLLLATSAHANNGSDTRNPRRAVHGILESPPPLTRSGFAYIVGCVVAALGSLIGAVRHAERRDSAAGYFGFGITGIGFLSVAVLTAERLLWLPWDWGWR